MNMLYFSTDPEWVLLQNYKGIAEKLHKIITILIKSIDFLSLVMCMLLKYLNISLNKTVIETYIIFGVLFVNSLVFAGLLRGSQCT